MFSITLIVVGKLKEKFYQAAVDEYSKRLQAFCKFQLIELPEYRLSDNPGETEIRAALSKEFDSIRARLPKGAWLCVLTPEGVQQSSEQLAQTLKQIKLSGRSTACFTWRGSWCWNSSTGQNRFRPAPNITNNP